MDDNIQDTEESSTVIANAADALSEYMSLPKEWGLPDLYLTPSKFDLDNDTDMAEDFSVEDFMPVRRRKGGAFLVERIALKCLNDEFDSGGCGTEEEEESGKFDWQVDLVLLRCLWFKQYSIL